VSRFPWKDLAPALAALVGLGVAWGVLRGLLTEGAGGVVNSAAEAAAALLVIWAGWRGSRHARKRTSEVHLEGQRRSALIDMVQARWIGIRDDSGRLRGDGKLAQDLALGNELEIFLERSTADGAANPASLKEAWSNAGHSMVLTGAPGAGKSVQLLLLAEMLLNEAVRDPKAGVPVILGLPAWDPADRRHGRTGKDDCPFEEWLVAELHAKFQMIPEDNTGRWLEDGDLIPILDGLDETSADHRGLLFEQLVKWVKDRSPAAWALGCREQEYAELDPNYDRIGGRRTFWSVKAVGDEERVRFLRYAEEKVNAAWQPVVDALERGEARNLTSIDGGEQGVLATPLGLTIAVEAYQPDDLNDPGTPTELLDPKGDWDRLWTRYVSHRYLLAHKDPDVAAGDIKHLYSLDEARRWLATLASEEIGIGRDVDVIHIRPPDQPAEWANAWSRVKDLERFTNFLQLYSFYWAILFAAFGTLIGWRSWGGSVAIVIVVSLAVICGFTLKIAGFPKYVESSDEWTSVKDIKVAIELMKRRGHQYIALVILCGLPGLLAIAACAPWLGVALVRLINIPYVPFSRLIERIPGVHHLQPIEATTGASGGFWTAVAVGVFIAGLTWFVYVYANLSRLIMRYRKRDFSARPSRSRHLLGKYFWWLDSSYRLYLFYERYDRWAGRHILLRWWHYGSPIGSRKPTGLIPHPKEWDNFLDWAAYRGYLRRIDKQYVWLHETLRIWFRKYVDSEALRALGK
jgi:hypothetical protein